jgi:cytochrome c biogenesis protein
MPVRAMSTAQPPSPRIGASQSLAIVWRTLRSMRTALVLLLLLALGSVAGSLVPQVPNSPEAVADYLVDHPFWGEFLRRAGFFDVFGSWWFVLITTLLVVSLVACLGPRTRALVTAVRAKPVQARELDGFPHAVRTRVNASAADAHRAAERTLRRRRFKTAADGVQVAGEKGLAREVGSLLFHWAFLLLVLGVIVGKGTGFSGYIRVIEGQTWTDAAANYAELRTGRFFSGNFTGVQVRLRDFASRFRETGQPMDFVSAVDLQTPSGELIRQQDIRVNRPASVDGIRIYQSGFGWAPVVRARLGGETIADAPIAFVQRQAPEGVGQLAVPWSGFLKLADVRPQMAIEFELWPDGRAFAAALEGELRPMTEAHEPLLRYVVWRGPLLDISQTSLDTTGMRRMESGIVYQGNPATIDTATGPMSVEFPELREYSVFQVARDSGVPLVLAAAILVLVGIVAALFVSRRKVWVRAEPYGTGTLLTVGGFALQRKDAFDDEFERLTGALVAACGGVRDAEPQTVGAP